MKNGLIGPPVDAPVLLPGFIYEVTLKTPNEEFGPIPHKRYWRVHILQVRKYGFFGKSYRTVGRSGAYLFPKKLLMDPKYLREACERAFDDMEQKELVKSIKNKYEGLHSGS